jgi:hypothetical protein
MPSASLAAVPRPCSISKSSWSSCCCCWRQHTGEERQPADADSHSADGQLLGTALQATADTWGEALQQRVRRAIEHNVADVAVRQLWLNNWQQLRVGVYKEALLPGGHHVTSTAFTRSRSRDGTAIMAALSWCLSLGPAMMQSSLTLPVCSTICSCPCPLQQLQGSRAKCCCLLCDLLPYLLPYDDADICGHDSIIMFGRDKGSRSATFQSLDYPVMLSSVECPLLRQEYQGQDGCTWWAFVPLYFKTGGRRAR